MNDSFDFRVSTNKDVTAEEYAQLARSVGWGSEEDSKLFVVSNAAYPLVVHARETSGLLIGYLSAFSDGAFSTMLGELIVHNQFQGHGVGRAMLEVVEKQWPGVPIYIKALGEAKHFFKACGYKVPLAEMTILFKRP
jgi:GNAT superfamily N-acetyltransferase